MEVAQFVEKSLQTTDVRGSNPVIGIIYIIYLLSTVYCHLRGPGKYFLWNKLETEKFDISLKLD